MKPASLVRKDLAKRLVGSIVLMIFGMVIISYWLMPNYTVTILLSSGVFLINLMVFSVYAFRFSGSRSRFLMMQSFSKGVMLKMALFVMAVAVIYRLDGSRFLEPDQAAVFFGTFLTLQLAQIGFSVFLAKKL